MRKMQWLSSLLAFESEIKKELVALDNGTFWQSQVEDTPRYSV
jgi:hypothetical protein